MDYVARIFCRSQKAEIHCPQFGSGLAGGNWEFITELIEDIWVENGLAITVYEYVPLSS